MELSTTIPDFIDTKSEVHKKRWENIRRIVLILSQCIDEEVLDIEYMQALDESICESLNEMSIFSEEFTPHCSATQTVDNLYSYHYVLEIFEQLLEACLENELYESMANLNHMISLKK